MKKNNKPYEDYKTEDFLIDESFISWVKGNTSVKDWDRILDQYPHLLPFSEEAKDMISGLRFKQEDYDEIRMEDLKKRIRFRTEEAETKIKRDKVFSLKRKVPRNKLNKSKKWFWMAAAMIAILLTIGIVFPDFLAEQKITNSSSDFTVRKTDKGQKLTVFLSDGTKVMLNGNSKIIFGEKFNDTLRMVYLEGEAFFEVTRDTTRPFLVDANGTVTQALGTSFNINQKGKKVQVSLVTGKVSVEKKAKGFRDILDPGEQLVIDVTKGFNAVKQDFDSGEVLAWTTGILFFKHAGSREVFEKIENWYGVEIEVQKTPGAMENWSYSGSFQNESLQNVLKSIGMVKDFRFRTEGTTVIIY